jgi:integration host factor subunit beta
VEHKKPRLELDGHMMGSKPKALRNKPDSSVTKSELIAKLATRYPELVAKDAELAVKLILEAMRQSLSQGQRIEIRGFSSFGLHLRPPRAGRNPRSGERVQVPAKYVPHFKASKELRERVDIKK